MQLMITDLSPSVASTSTEHGSTNLFLCSENANQPSVKKLTSEFLTESERRTTMREKADKVKTNNQKPSKKQKKETYQCSVKNTIFLKEVMLRFQVSECLLKPHYKVTRGLLATDLAQVSRIMPELEPPLQTTIPHQREDFEPRQI
ncbi:hypothetical protein TNCV_1883131 [Trichonephila clavipes]|nr:hypothetical protein TNCV_1883131 [Trichonephila clavipes]